MSELSVGILGFGGAGIAHKFYYECVPGCRVTRIFDVKDPARARAAKLAPDLPYFTELAEFLDGLDAVSICTPDATHADYIVAVLDRGVSALCEKPLTESVEGIRRILAAEGRGKARLGVLHQMRFLPLFEEMKRTVDGGELGDLAYLEGYYVHDLTERAFQFDDWRETSEATPLVYAGCHFVDLLRWMTAEEPGEVYAMAGHVAFPRYPESDLNVALLRFPSGAVGKVVASIGTAGPQDHTVRIYGSRASIDNSALFGRDKRQARTLHRPRWVHKEMMHHPDYRRLRNLFGEVRIHGAARLLVRCFELLGRLSGGPDAEYAARHFPVRLYEHGVACIRAVTNFVEAVRGQGTIRCPGDESARTVLACLAGVESFRTNRPVEVKKLEELV